MKIERLTRKDKSETVEVLTSAFQDYPVMRFVLKTNGEEYATQLKAIMEFYCEARLAKDRPVLGVRKKDALVAVALVDETSLKPWAEMRTELLRLKSIIREEAYSRLELYEKMSSRAEPSTPHHFLGMIAVRPKYQGKGYARALMDAVKQISLADANSSGVCLSTEDPENVRLYEHFGYRVIAEIDIEELHSWCMFLSTEPKTPPALPSILFALFSLCWF
jgi:ribosomal protein S18 acetylase RimI-like enzyme